MQTNESTILFLKACGLTSSCWFVFEQSTYQPNEEEENLERLLSHLFILHNKLASLTETFVDMKH